MEWMPATAAEARRCNRPHYLSDKPCIRGHFALRTVGSGRCVECRREEKAANGATKRAERMAAAEAKRAEKIAAKAKAAEAKAKAAETKRAERVAAKSEAAAAVPKPARKARRKRVQPNVPANVVRAVDLGPCTCPACTAPPVVAPGPGQSEPAPRRKRDFSCNDLGLPVPAERIAAVLDRIFIDPSKRLGPGSLAP
jgi:hypothetical protein